MGVGIQDYRYGGVAWELLDVLRVCHLGEQQHRAGVPEVMEADPRELRPLQ